MAYFVDPEGRVFGKTNRETIGKLIDNPIMNIEIPELKRWILNADEQQCEPRDFDIGTFVGD